MHNTAMPLLTGRDRELSVLRDRLDAVLVGKGSLVLISGEAGIGKTALADRVAREAADMGAIVLAGHCYDRTETPPYGPWIEVARHVQTLSDIAHAPTIPLLDAVASQVALFAQARDFLAALAAERPLVLVFEDLHWADSASLDLLRFIAHGIDGMPLLLVATYRNDEVDRRHPLAALVPLLVREAPTERLRLRPLDTAAARVLVLARHNLAESAAHRLATYLIERTEGNALFMTELLRSLEEERLLDRLDGGSHAEVLARTPVPLLLKQIVDDRLARLGDETAALLVIAAVIGQEVLLAVWQAVAAVDEETLLTATEHAEAAHLVTPWPNGQGIRFTHALIRDVLYEDISALRRRRIHRRVGDALLTLPAPDFDTVAYHLQRAGDVRAVAWLVRAGERAEDTHALVTAAERYEAAFTLLDAQQGDSGERGWLRLLAASLRRHEDRVRALAWTEEAVQLAVTARDSSLVARAQALLGLIIGQGGNHRAAAANIAAAADMIDQLPQSTGVAYRREQQIDMVANRGTLISALALSGRLVEARKQGDALLAQFAQSATTRAELGVIAGVHLGLAVASALQGEPIQARRSYAAAVAAYRTIDQYVLAYAFLREELILAVLPYQADDLAERERVATEAERTAVLMSEYGVHGNPNLPQYARIPLLVLEGRWREARQIMAQPDTPDFALTGHTRDFYQGTLARAQGDLETAWRCVLEPSWASAKTEPGDGMEEVLQLQFQLLAAGLALDGGDLPAARGWLDLHRRWLDFTGATLGRAEEALVEAEWHRVAGDNARAHAYAERALAHATTPRQPLALIAAHRTLAIFGTDAGKSTAVEEHFAAALALADACRAPYERALTLIAHAEHLMTTDERGRVPTLLNEARTLCLPMDATPALAQIERLTARLGGVTDRPPAGLSAREVEVLRLVASGLTNAQVAEHLFLSPRTVNSHLTTIYTKLDVPSRAAAVRFALDHGLA